LLVHGQAVEGGQPGGRGGWGGGGPALGRAALAGACISCCCRRCCCAAIVPQVGRACVIIRLISLLLLELLLPLAALGACCCGAAAALGRLPLNITRCALVPPAGDDVVCILLLIATHIQLQRLPTLLLLPPLLLLLLLLVFVLLAAAWLPWLLGCPPAPARGCAPRGLGSGQRCPGAAGAPVGLRHGLGRVRCTCCRPAPLFRAAGHGVPALGRLAGRPALHSIVSAPVVAARRWLAES
jgi:hypothetical protein